MWYNFILLIFFKVNCKKISSNQDFFFSVSFFTDGHRNFRLPSNLENLVNLLDKIIQTNFEF
jgi:hypothetical protein